MLANPQGCHICFIIPNNPPHSRAPKVHDKLKLTNSPGQCNIKAAGLPCKPCHGMSYLFYRIEPRMISNGLRFYFFLLIKTLIIFFIDVLNTNIIPLLNVTFCSGLVTFRHAWGSWKHHVLNNMGNHETAPWQRVLMRRLLDSGC